MILSNTKKQFVGSVPEKNLIGSTIANNFFTNSPMRFS